VKVMAEGPKFGQIESKVPGNGQCREIELLPRLVGGTSRPVE